MGDRRKGQMGYLGDLFKHTRSRDLLFYGGYSLYLVFSYMAFHSPTLLKTGGETGPLTQVLFMASIIAASLVVYGIVAFSSRFFKPLPGGIAAAAIGAFAIAGFMVAGMSFQFYELLPDSMVLPWLVLAGALLGFADALITLLWARFSATLTLRTVYVYVLSCNAISLVIYFVVTLLPNQIALPLAAVIFIASVVFAKKSLDVRGSFSWEYSKPVFESALRRMATPILGTAILCFMSGLMLQISGQHDIPLASFQRTSLFTSAIVVIALLLPALLIKKPLHVGRMYAFAIPLSAAGFLLLPLIWNAAGGIVNSFVQLGSMVAGIILWCILADISHDTKLPPTLLFSLALIATNAAQLAGTVVGYMNAETLRQGDLVLTTVALVAAYLLFMVALLLFKDKSLKGEECLEVEKLASGEGQLAGRCDALAGQHQFTPRETEIFHLLAQGYTIPVISEKLFVSENTVKSHVKSIYQKLDIHMRTELIELVNAQ